MHAGDETFTTALTLAARSYLEHPFADAAAEQAAVRRIEARLGWSPVRARWFLSVNRETIERLAQELRAQPPPED
jgi:hypothetical protein